ncbi:hypothetical protein [Leptolyngbya iicbica]|uniref:Uncharacterized protein n=2 Tax=Cyanophyceae TaxID=3028117 RepID=A0A4Q7EA34_9CYAN|nr:hypothetical protein [Leptolyngbya sp. LK]RZM79421.1 hypothetical protein DYY88_11810 [Leptolyngbya sp. LK]
MNSDRLFSEVYTLDKSTNRYMIEIALDRYEDIFNEWDPAPFKKREIDSELELYLEGSVEEIPFRFPIELIFMLPTDRQDTQREEEVRIALKNYFGFRLYFLRRELRKINIRLLRYVVIGFLLLWVGVTYPGYELETDWARVATEGIFIGGWVFLWEAVSLFFFSKREIYHRYQMFKKLLHAPVYFREAVHQSS